MEYDTVVLALTRGLGAGGVGGGVDVFCNVGSGLDVCDVCDVCDLGGGFEILGWHGDDAHREERDDTDELHICELMVVGSGLKCVWSLRFVGVICVKSVLSRSSGQELLSLLIDLS